ncbi:MAG: S-DNA-T family DNA segregation ATPase FtsK/SpoIIIE [Planctomycetota bacterium]
MTKKQNKQDEPKTKRGTRFVPAEDVPMPGLSQRSREVVALALCGFSLYAMLALATFRWADLDAVSIPSGNMENLGGAVGYHLAHGFARALGFAGWVPFMLMLAFAMLLFVGRKCERLTIKLLGAVCFAAMLSILFAGDDGMNRGFSTTPYGAGGVFGATVSPKLDSAFGGTGRLLLVWFGALLSLLIATEWMFSQLLLRAYSAIEPLVRRWFRSPAVAAAGVGELDDEDEVAKPRRSRRKPKKAVIEVEEEEEEAEEEEEEAEEEEAEEEEEVEEEEEEDAPPRARRRSRSRKNPAKEEEEPEEEPEAEVEEEAVVEITPEPEPVLEPPKPKPILIMRPKAKKRRKKPAAQSDLPFADYPFPPVELFQEPQSNDLGLTSEALEKGGAAIVNKLANFKIESEVVAASVGPAVTQYELRLAESIRVNKIVGFESDLAAALKAYSVRVVAPIPGKDTVGIEVPNEQREKVYMRDLLDMFGRADDHAIPLFLGKDVAGNPIVEDLARMPHLLIAGTTGSGKSVCINTILLSILMTRTPQQVKLILVDPKMVELQAYKKVPHLCCEVVTNMKKAPGVLQWAVDEMENRYAMLSVAGVNHIKNYNRLGQQELAKRMGREPDPDRVYLSYIVIVIDEFADLMNVSSNEVEDLIQRLAQKSRAVGMHIILATQRPSSDVITGIIKANLPCQISFKVNRRIDSRVILDVNGAEKLLGHGDMLYMPPSGGALLRAQGTFVSDEEMAGVVKYLEDQGQAPSFNPDLVQRQSSSRPTSADRDDRYNEAVEVIVGQQRGSATLLQRALAVGYTRATRLLELMEDDGIVGPFVGSKSREVMLTLEEWQARLEAEAAAGDEDEYEDVEYEDDDEATAEGEDEQTEAEPSVVIPSAEGAVSAEAAAGEEDAGDAEAAEDADDDSLGSIADAVTPDAVEASPDDPERPEGA